MVWEMQTSYLDSDHVKDLAAGFKIIPQIDPIWTGRSGEILIGNHRLEATKLAGIDPYKVPLSKRFDTRQKAEELTKMLGTKITEDLVETIASVHSDKRKRTTEATRRDQFIIIAEDLLKNGAKPDRIAVLVHQLAGFTQGYIDSLLPDRFKNESKAISSGRPSLSKINTKSQEMEAQLQKTGVVNLPNKSLPESEAKTALDLKKSTVIPGDKTLPSGTSRSAYRKPTYTELAVEMEGICHRAGLFVKHSEYAYPRDETNKAGEIKKYWPDIVLEAGAVLHVEGEGSASVDDPNIDKFWHKKGMRSIHVSNDLIRAGYGMELALAVKECLLPIETKQSL